MYIKSMYVIKRDVSGVKLLLNLYKCWEKIETYKYLLNENH